MHPPGDADDYERADDRCSHYRHPLLAYEVEVSEQSHARWHEEKSEIPYKKVCHASHVAQPDDAELQSECKQ